MAVRGLATVLDPEFAPSPGMIELTMDTANHGGPYTSNVFMIYELTNLEARELYCQLGLALAATVRPEKKTVRKKTRKAR